MVGSIIKYARRGTVVWGAGTKRANQEVSPDADYRAVRGPLTRAMILHNGGKCPDIYGDPALLLPRFYRPKRDKKFKVGLVRHYVHLDVPVILGDGATEIPIKRCGYDGIERFIDEILECEVILSSSLHGIIAANAYGIPALWCDFSGSEATLDGDGTNSTTISSLLACPLKPRST